MKSSDSERNEKRFEQAACALARDDEVIKGLIALRIRDIGEVTLRVTNYRAAYRHVRTSPDNCRTWHPSPGQLTARPADLCVIFCLHPIGDGANGNRHRKTTIVSALGAATVVCPVSARAQQPGIPVIGFLDVGSLETARELIAAFQRGLSETGYVEGRNVSFEYIGADGQYDRLPALVTELVRRQVTLIAAPGRNSFTDGGKGFDHDHSGRLPIGGRPRCDWPCC